MKISIIVPAYNVENYIETCIKSILKQTYSNIDLIIINDGSTDKTLNIIKRYSEYNNIHIITKKNDCVSSARNIGIKESTGEYLFLLDSDDWIDAHYIEKCVKEISNYNLDILFTPYIKEYKNRSIKNDLFQKNRIIFEDRMDLQNLRVRLFGPSGTEQKSPLLLDNLSPVWGKFYRKETIDKILFEDLESIGSEDLWFNINVFKNAKKIGYYGEVYLHYNKTNENSIVSTKNINMNEQWKNLYSKMEEFILENELNNIFFEALYNREVLNFFGLMLKTTYLDINYMDKKKIALGILNDSAYKDAIQKFSLKNMKLMWYLFYKNIKNHNFFMIYCILKSAENFKKRLNK